VDAVDLIKSDHVELRKHMKAYMDAHEKDDSDTCTREIRQLCDLLTVHALIEEDYFYPAAQQQDEKELTEIVQEGYEEHAIATQLVEEIQEMADDDPQLMAKGKVLCESVEHHMKEEEDEMLPKAAKELGKPRLEELGKAMKEVKSKAMSSMSS
jgi:hemerythrin superfamily protein